MSQYTEVSLSWFPPVPWDLLGNISGQQWTQSSLLLRRKASMAAGGQRMRARQEGACGQDMALALLPPLPSLPTCPLSHHFWPETPRCLHPYKGAQEGKGSAQLELSPSPPVLHPKSGSQVSAAFPGETELTSLWGFFHLPLGTPPVASLTKLGLLNLEVFTSQKVQCRHPTL